MRRYDRSGTARERIEQARLARVGSSDEGRAHASPRSFSAACEGEVGTQVGRESRRSGGDGCRDVGRDALVFSKIDDGLGVGVCV